MPQYYKQTNFPSISTMMLAGDILAAMSQLKDRVREARKDAKLTQEKLAKAIGVSQANIAMLESGEIKETALIVKIALATKVSAYWLDSGRGRKKMTELEAVILNLSEMHQRQALALIEALKSAG